MARWALAGAHARHGASRRGRRCVETHDGPRRMSASGAGRNSEGPVAPQVTLSSPGGGGGPSGPRGQEFRHGQGHRWGGQQGRVRSTGGSRQGGWAKPFARVAPPPSWLGTCILLHGCRWAGRPRWGRGGARLFGPEFSSDETGDGPASITNFFRRVAGPAPVSAPGLLTGGTPLPQPHSSRRAPELAARPRQGPAAPAAPQESGRRMSTRGILAQLRTAGAPLCWTCQPEARPWAGGADFAWSAMAPSRRGEGGRPLCLPAPNLPPVCPRGGPPGGQAGQVPGVPSLQGWSWVRGPREGPHPVPG